MRHTLALPFSILLAAPAPLLAQARAPLGRPAGALAGPGAFAVGLQLPDHVPADLFRLDWTPDKIELVMQGAKADLEARIEAIVEIPDDQRTFENTMLALTEAYDLYGEETRPLGFLKNVSNDKDVRETIERLQQENAPYFAALGYREDIYRAIKALEALSPALDGEDKKLFEQTLRGYRDMGMDLPAASKQRLQDLGARLSNLSQRFAANLRNANETMEVSPEDLRGLPDDLIASLEPGRKPGTLTLPVEDAVGGRVLTLAESEDLRRRYAYRDSNVAWKANVPLLQEALELRAEKAAILGKKTYAELKIDGEMAQTPERVFGFLERLRRLLTPRAQEEDAELLERVRRDLPDAERVDAWNSGYYARKLKMEKHAVDGEKVREYFPAGHVVDEALKFYEGLLGLEFREVKEKAWDTDVRLFAVHDAKSGKLLSHFFMDLFPREGKYQHAAAFPLVSGRELADGSYQKPVSAIVANFTKATKTRPALLSHEQVKTFFHEFGHIMHQTLTTARRSDFSGTSVAGDFVEAPSQMVENFIWQKDILRRVSKHYATGAALPDDLIDAMIAARNFRSARAALGQVALATLDMVYHTVVPKNTTLVMRAVFKRVLGRAPMPGTHFHATFGHLMSHYAAGYYGYLWSRVYAQDIFSRFRDEGLTNPKTGMDYRRAILEKGGTEEALDLLREFLGREPDEREFLRYLGIDPGAAPGA